MRAPTIVLAAALALACAPRDREVRLARLKAQGRSLDATFDRLEDRLVADRGRVEFWKEMRQRHERVAAIACAVQDEQAVEMAEHRLPPEGTPRYQARVAAAREAAAERDAARAARD